MGSPERSILLELLQVFKDIFLELPEKARNYMCKIVVKVQKPFMDRSYLVLYSKNGAM